MNTLTRDPAFAPPGHLPFDLGVWIGERALLELALEVTTEFTGLVSRGAWSTHLTNGIRPATMLTLLTFCYARGVLASSQIQHSSSRDPMVRYLTDHHEPKPAGLRAFRRCWRRVIQRCLVNLFTLAWQARSSRHAAAEPANGFAPGSRSRAVQPELRRLFLAEAAARVERAVQLDSMDLDE